MKEFLYSFLGTLNARTVPNPMLYYVGTLATVGANVTTRRADI